MTGAAVGDCQVCYRHHPNDAGDCTTGCRHRDADVLACCGPCAQRVRDDLDAILAAWLAPEPITSGSGRGNERPLPGGTEWLDFRQGADLRDVAGSWAKVWHEDISGIMDPPAWPGADPGAVVAWLRRWWDVFGAGHEAAREFADDMHDLGQRARRLLGDTPTGQVVLCPGLDDDCGRRLRIDVADPDARITCRACGTEWTAGRLMVHGADGYVDADAIHHVYGVPPSTLRRWAKVGKVRRQGLGYSVVDVRGVMSGRVVDVG